MVSLAVNAVYSTELLVKRTRSPAKIDFDSLEEEVTDAFIDELKSAIVGKESDAKEDKATESKPKSKMQTSESRVEDIWLEPSSEPSSLFDDPNENDALHSRDYTNSNKREEYYENLEKKSLRSTYTPPPRKNFYTTPEVIDASASEEYIHEERRNNRRPLRIADSHEDYYPDKDPLTDVIHSESHHLTDSLDLMPFRGAYQARAMQIPPWRFSSGRPYSSRPSPPVIVSERQKTHEPSPDPLISKAAAVKPRGTYRMMSTVPRRPVHVHTPKIHYNNEAKFKALPKSKPWVTEHKKETVAPKFTPKAERIVARSGFASGFGSGFGRGTRQQFHEQGTRGPHSYKFGYNTGDRENPMARYEERGADGIVRGSYSYIDARGHKQVVHYESHPKFGFKTKLNSDF